ncbi:MAG TPA: MBL fold metallo-hydrolase [Candidatus Limnocylindria bacterium]|nr:MBL fold metallo-hydrolase [Candidatus Limnocylindria bacterium]
MTTRLRFLGAAGYEIAGPRWRALIDPFLTGNPVAPVGPDDLETPDVILVTHAAYDHVGDTARIARRTGAPIVCGADTRAWLIEQGVPAEQIRATVWGIVVEVGGVVVRPVECHHWSSARLANGNTITGTPLAFIVEPEPGLGVYHFGDTAIFSDLRLIGELYHPAIGLIGCTHPKELVAPVLPGPGRMLTGEMSPREAALAAELLGVRFAVATHYFNERDEEVREFLRLVTEMDTTGKRVGVAPRAGDVLETDGTELRAVVAA